MEKLSVCHFDEELFSEKKKKQSNNNFRFCSGAAQPIQMHPEWL